MDGRRQKEGALDANGVTWSRLRVDDGGGRINSIAQNVWRPDSTDCRPFSRLLFIFAARRSSPSVPP